MRLLLFSLSNVLGHLTRCFALAEAAAARGHQVHLAHDGHYAALTKALPEGIQRHLCCDMPPQAARQALPLQHLGHGPQADAANLAALAPAAPVAERAQTAARMLAQDRALIRDIRPDAVISDYRFTAPIAAHECGVFHFHLSHLAGFPSFTRRTLGRSLFAQTADPVLVPSAAELELASADWSPSERARFRWCGRFHWAGWRRLHPQGPQPQAEALLFFGSTGDGDRAVQHLRQNLPPQMSVRIAGRPPARGPHHPHESWGQADLDTHLSHAELMICHGGHGTVLAGLNHRRPMLIFPVNVEQHEIASHLVRLGAAVLAPRPVHETSEQQLHDLLTQTRRLTIPPKLAQLAAPSGADTAVQHIERHLQA
jgi:hypothetical protein